VCACVNVCARACVCVCVCVCVCNQDRILQDHGVLVEEVPVICNKSCIKNAGKPDKI